MRARESLALAAAGAVLAVLLPAGAASADVVPAAGVAIKFGHSDKCVNVAGGSTADKATVVQYGCIASARNDKFTLVPRSGDTYWIRAQHSGKCLNVGNNSQLDSAPIIQYTCSDSANTRWRVTAVRDRPTVRLVSASSGKCLNVPHSVTDDNEPLIQYACATGPGALNDQVYFPPATSARPAPLPLTAKQPVAVVQGAAPDEDGVGPIHYSWIDRDNDANTVAVRNPDPENTDPDAPGPVRNATTGHGYTGRPSAAVLADGRVQVTLHDAAAGDVVLADETEQGGGAYGDPDDIGGATPAQPVTARLTPDGALATFALHARTLWFAPQVKGNSPTSYAAWRDLGGTGLTGVPAVVPTAAGVRIFARRSDGALLTTTYAGGRLADWATVTGAGVAGDPAAVAGPDGRVTVFVRDPAGTVTYKRQNTDGTFPAAPQTLAGGTTPGTVSPVVDPGTGSLAVALRDAAGLLHLAYETAPGSGIFGAPVQLSDPETRPESIAAHDPTAFAYDVPSGASFGIAFPSASDAVDEPLIYQFASAEGPSKRAATAPLPEPELRRLGESTR